VAPPPLNNLCSMEGCDFAPVTLPSCSADGGEVIFYDPTSFCGVQATLLVIAAGWCVPCQMEAPMIEQLITAAPEYQGRVRVITVIGQNPDYSAPTPAFCRTWQSRYRLTSTMAIDPMGVTQRYFPNMAFPANLIIDAHGRIRYRTYGTSRGLTELRAALDDVLANP
jgi:thiol-disulfide isomerase/thioredoxin